MRKPFAERRFLGAAALHELSVCKAARDIDIAWQPTRPPSVAKHAQTTSHSSPDSMTSEAIALKRNTGYGLLFNRKSNMNQRAREHLADVGKIFCYRSELSTESHPLTWRGKRKKPVTRSLESKCATISPLSTLKSAKGTGQRLWRSFCRMPRIDSVYN